MNKRVLFVDDEPNVLSGIRRSLHGHADITTCEDPKQALELVRDQGPFALIVSDMRMPGMDGVQFLSAVREIASDSVRVMLTGNADQKTAMDAVNKGEIFRFLTKPCDADMLRQTLALGLRQFQLITAEKELLGKTLHGSVKVLSEVLAIANPEAFGRTDRIRAKAREIAARLDGVCTWELDTAASLSLLGCVGLRAELLEKIMAGDTLSRSESDEYSAHPLLAAELINHIPRMQGVADIILYQHKHFDGKGFPRDERKGQDIPLGARILHLVLAYDELKGQGWSDAAVYEKLNTDAVSFDPDVLAAFRACLDESATDNIVRLPVPKLKRGMIICEDVKTSQGVLLVCQGQQVTVALQQHLMKFFKAGTLDQQLLVATPVGTSQSSEAA